ncbi:MAG: DUF2344 domain-containing protein [Dehalococcoidales bacterium]|nr:DUF2344 domain-containing protein [Dehalococcoidales bacterium]
MQRLRVRFSRGDEIKYISHLDIMRLWERALKRAGIRLAYSEGFSPHPRISMAAPLAVGVTAESELLDLYIDGTATPHWFIAAVNSRMPEGISILDVQQVSPVLPSLQAQLRMAEYTVKLQREGGPEDIDSAITQVLSQEKLPWFHERDTGKREYDLRPLIDDIKLASCTEDSCVLDMRLRCDNTGSGRPEQVALALGFPAYPTSITRTRLLLQN